MRFTSECLGFANVPEAETVHALTGGAAAVTHHPRWKQRVPRDTGPGWDFEDVRDFYLRHLFGVDPVRLRSFDPARYLQLSRVVPGEMMAAAFAEWRGGHSRNTGALVWFFTSLSTVWLIIGAVTLGTLAVDLLWLTYRVRRDERRSTARLISGRSAKSNCSMVAA